MRVLREVKGQHERFIPRVHDFDTASVERGLGDKADLWVNFSKLHVLVISHFEFPNPTLPTVRMEQRGTFWAEIRLGTRCNGEAENRTLLVTEEITVNNPLRIHSFRGKFMGGDGWTRIFHDELRILIGFEVKGVH